ncbi:MAG TPA: PocR ligand-binding domain-containing protein [Clostridiales bacterium]|nr:PocR ligand-binding domain-containing protein [Clostridiales bacterium]
MDNDFVIGDIEFNIDRAIQAVNAYSHSTGIRCIIIDSKGKTLYEKCVDMTGCLFCKKAEDLLGEHQSCTNAHLYGSYQAERFGGKYVFFCPMGLVHWVSPITKNNILKGAVLAGPVQMVEPEEFLIEDILRKNNIKEEDINAIKESVHDIPVIKTEVVNSMSEILYIVAAYISNVQPSKYLEEIEALEQQSDISEYIHYIKTFGGDSSELNSYPIEKEKELLMLISIGDKAGSQKILNEIFGHIFFSTGGNFEVIKARVLELTVLLSRAALEGGADAEQIFGLNYIYLNEIHSFSTVEELTYWLSNIMMRFTDCVFTLAGVKHVDVIYRAIEYIKRSYMKKVTLEEVASYVYLSPAYFSKIFKEEMKTNFNSYLNHIRIEMAKKLLLDDTISLVDVSNVVGYEDQSYFSKVFKRMVGVSPGKYREARGKI